MSITEGEIKGHIKALKAKLYCPFCGAEKLIKAVGFEVLRGMLSVPCEKCGHIYVYEIEKQPEYRMRRIGEMG